MKNIKILTYSNREFNLQLDSVKQLFFDEGIDCQLLCSENKKSEECNDDLDSEYIISEFINKPNADLLLISGENIPYPLPKEIEILALVCKNGLKELNEESPLTNYWAIIGLKGKVEWAKEFSNKYDERQKWGRVILAGFGPGDPWLITKKAEYNLHRAEVIFYDDLVNQKYLDRFCAKKIYVGKRKGQHKYDQRRINEKMYKAAIKGKWVVRIKGGDPLIFGRGAEEFHYLKSRLVNAEIIPGITSAFAAAASSVIPLTERSLSSSVVFLSGHDLNKLRIPKADTLVFYMGASNQKELATRIIDEGWHENTPVGIIHNASVPDEQTYRGTLSQLKCKDSGLPSPSIIIVGKTAQPFRDQPKKWLYTGLSVNDWEYDEGIVHTPLITIEPVEFNHDINVAIENIQKYDRLIFTNRYAVQFFFKLLFDLGKDARVLSHIQIDSIGKVTSQALKEKGLLVKPLCKEESSVAMVKEYKNQKVVKENILIPGSGVGANRLTSGLRDLGNAVNYLSIYKMDSNGAIVKQNLDQFYGIIFTSPQTVKAFMEVYGKIPAHLEIVTRGSQTKAIVNKLLEEKSKLEVNDI